MPVKPIPEGYRSVLWRSLRHVPGSIRPHLDDWHTQRRCFAGGDAAPRVAAGALAANLMSARSEFFDLTRFHVVNVARGEDKVRFFPWLIQSRVVMYSDLPRTDCLELVTAYNNRRTF